MSNRCRNYSPGYNGVYGSTAIKINDIVIGNRKNTYGYLFPVPLYELINSETGEKNYYSTIVPVDGLFEEALDQFIAYKLSKVETDNNSIIANDNHGYSVGNRYANVKI